MMSYGEFGEVPKIGLQLASEMNCSISDYIRLLNAEKNDISQELLSTLTAIKRLSQLRSDTDAFLSPTWHKFEYFEDN